MWIWFDNFWNKFSIITWINLENKVVSEILFSTIIEILFVVPEDKEDMIEVKCQDDVNSAFRT